MKKKILSFALLLAVVLSFALPTFATSAYDGIRVSDEADVMTSEDFQTVFDTLCALSSQYGVELLIKTENADGYLPGEDAVNTLAQDYYTQVFDGKTVSCVLLYVLVADDGSESAVLRVEGDAQSIFDENRQTGLLDGLMFGDVSTRFVDYTSECASILATTTPSADTSFPTDTTVNVVEDPFDMYRIIDKAGFMTSSDFATVYTKLCEASRKYGVELFIYTEKSGVEETDENINRYVRNFYNEIFDNEAGKDCVILYVIDDTADLDLACVYSNGKAKAAVNFDAQEHLRETLRDGGTSDRFVLYADECIRLLDLYESTGKEYKEPFGWFGAIAISLGIGFVIALIVVLVMKGKLKTVRFRNDATDYTVPDSMNVTDERELYLYSTVVATPKPKESSSSSSSSGSSDGGISSSGRV